MGPASGEKCTPELFGYCDVSNNNDTVLGEFWTITFFLFSIPRGIRHGLLNGHSTRFMR